MAAADAEICRLRRYNRFGVHGEKEFARLNPRLECRPIFNHIRKHPTLALWRVDRAHRRVDGIRCGDAVAAGATNSFTATASSPPHPTPPPFQHSSGFHINEM